jgi:HSP20 family protein
MFRYFDVTDEMDRMRREMDRMFRSVSGAGLSTPGGYPAMNMWLDGDNVILTAELPGVARDEVDISIEGNTLTLSGERKPQELPEGATYHRRECGYGKFTRVIKLPYMINLDEVKARMHNGVLEVKLERAEADKPRKIKVLEG